MKTGSKKLKIIKMNIEGLKINTGSEHSTVFNYADSVAYQSDAVVSKTIVKKETGTITVFAFGKGQGLSEHSAPFDAIIQIVDGSAEVFINKKPFIVKTGQTIILPANIPHAVQSITDFKMVLTMIKSS
jgi:quercetin dioxygenase-like cupin family protein